MDSAKLIQDYYDSFNTSNIEKLFRLIDDDIIHTFNYESCNGKAQFIEFINHIKIHYDEGVYDPIIMVSEDGQHVTSKIFVKGRYVKTDPTLEPYVEANNQEYQMYAINYFKIQDGLITEGTCWYDHNDWVSQITI